MSWQEEALRVAAGIRRRVLEMTLDNGGGYLSQACSAGEILATLYTHVMRLGPSEAPMVPGPFRGAPGPEIPTVTGAAWNGPTGPAFDRFFFSPVHYALVLYATLIEVGRLAPEAFAQFNVDGSTMELIGAEHSPGHEVTAGSLGQCLSQAAGVALARRLNGESGRTWVFMSDGEFQEGQTWEAFATLAYHDLSRVGVYVDVNAHQCDGPMAGVMRVDPLAERLRAFGARVHEVDGHDPDALALPAAEAGAGPLVVLARTDMCRGMAPLRGRDGQLHYIRFQGPEERARFAAHLAVLDAEEEA